MNEIISLEPTTEGCFPSGPACCRHTADKHWVGSSRDKPRANFSHDVFGGLVFMMTLPPTEPPETKLIKPLEEREVTGNEGRWKKKTQTSLKLV